MTNDRPATVELVFVRDAWWRGVFYPAGAKATMTAAVAEKLVEAGLLGALTNPPPPQRQGRGRRK